MASLRSVISRPIYPLRIVLLAACAAACSTTPYDVRSRPSFPAPDLETLSPVELRGYTIYLHDHAAWLASDLALGSGVANTPADGWITVEQPDGILVRFAGPCGDQVCSYFDVLVGSEATTVGSAAPDPLPSTQAAAWRARRLVLGSKFPACTPEYNTVVLPTEYNGEPAWVVYALASSTKPDEVILTGHLRFTVSYSGDMVILAEPLSKSCVITTVEESVAALFVSHILHPKPIETHVFTSLDYHLPLVVYTDTGAYQVEGAHITLVEDPR